MTSTVPVFSLRKRASYIGSLAVGLIAMQVIVALHLLSSLEPLSTRFRLFSDAIEDSLCSMRPCANVSFALRKAQRVGLRSSEQYIVSANANTITQGASLRNNLRIDREARKSKNPFRLPLREDDERKAGETKTGNDLAPSEAADMRPGLEPLVGQKHLNISTRELEQTARQRDFVKTESVVLTDTNCSSYESCEKSIMQSSPELFSNDRIILPKTRKASRRARWLKQNWGKFGILQSDDLSKMFASRMRTFLNGSGDGNSTELERSSGHGSSEERHEACKVRFFITWITKLSMFGPREQLCLESVFRTHPSACVVILSRSFDSESGRRLLLPFVEKGFRVTAITPDLPFLLRDTPAQRWFTNLRQGKMDPGKINLSQNLSNLLRLAVLYKYGGIYVDTDVILLRSVSSLGNALGAQGEEQRGGGWRRLNNAAMVFERGHPLVEAFLREFAATFNGNKWGQNGPYLVTRVVRKARKSGGGRQDWRILRAEAMYAVNWRRIEEVFRAGKREEVLEMVKNSVAIHLWNRQSRGMAAEAGSALDVLLQRPCVLCNPATLAAALRPQRRPRAG